MPQFEAFYRRKDYSMPNRIMALNLEDSLSLYLDTQFTKEQAIFVPTMTMKDMAHLIEDQKFQLIIVQYEEQKHSGSFMTALRRATFAPIIIVLNMFDVDRIRLLLNAGADLCLVESWPPELLFAYMLALMRRYTDYNHSDRPTGKETAPFYSGDIFIDPLRRTVQVLGRDINLRPREFSLLLFLMHNPGIILSAAQICEHAWQNEGSYLQGITGPMALLRKAIEPDPANPVYIETVRRVGYRFTAYKSETCDICSDTKVLV